MKRSVIVDYIAIAFGSLVMATGIGVFLVDAQVVPGGVSGLSLAVHYLSGKTLPVGLLMWIMNVPLYIWGVRELGRSFGARTFFAFSLNSFLIDFMRGAIPGIGVRVQDAASVAYLRENDFFFTVLLGGTLLGVGLGIIFKFRGTTGGSDIVAAIAHKRWGISPGQMIIFTDFFVISIAGLVLELKGLAEAKPAAALTLYAFLMLFLSGKLIDLVIDGFDYARSVFIISDHNAEIAKLVLEQLSRGATALHGRGLYRGVERDVLFSVVRRHEVRTLLELVRGVDPHAFVIISNVYEVQGQGFRARGEPELPLLGRKNGNGHTPPKPLELGAAVAEPAGAKTEKG